MPVDEVTRVRAGANASTVPDLLVELAADPAATVRAAVAMNASAPIDVDRLLAGDCDERVRSVLARKLATGLPGLRDADREPQQREKAQQTLQILAGLIGDDAVLVRAAVSETVKDMPEAPRNLILRLAHDPAVPVSYPIIRRSPVLTPDDLLELLRVPPNRSAASAVACREGLPAAVADKVVAAADAGAISALLGNHTANIRAATLQALAGAKRSEWKQLLTERPGLPAALSQFLTGRRKVRPPTNEDAVWEARQMASRGELDDQALLNALEDGDRRMASAILAVAANVPIAAVERVAAVRDIKALVSLVWRAGFSVQTAVPVQITLASATRETALPVGPKGRFPLPQEEMSYQINTLKNEMR